jgi:HAE1 family hydrophobic/amphiphilic exporter-1
VRLSRTATHRPIGTSIIYIAIALFGVVALRQLAVDLLPEVDMPRISITTAYEGVAPEEIETLITRPIEQAVSSIEGVERIEAVSAEGLSRVQLQFDWGKDLQEAVDDVRVAIDRTRSRLPEDAETPTVYKFDLSAAPVAFIGVTGAGDPRLLKHLAEDTLARRIERVPGVASVQVRGGRDREIRLELDADRLSALGITADQVATAVARENRTVSAGDMLDSGREVVIRTAGEYERVGDIESVVVATREGGPVRVRDVADVVDTYRELNSELWIDGEPGIRVMVYKQSGANTVAVVEELRAEIERVNRDYRGNVSLEVLWDSSSFIESAVTNVQSSALVGAALAVVVLLLFLGDIRATMVVATSIPLSVLATFGLMYFWGITLNVISFGGLALGIGLLVDAAIVILENIHHRREEGLDPTEAAVSGASEVGPAVLAGTLTTLAVFVPVVFIGGFEGVFFGEMAIVVSFALACSLAVALTLVPMLAARLLRRGRPSSVRANLSQRALSRAERAYERLVRGALTSPALVVILAVALLGTSVLLVPWVGFELMPETDEGRLDVDVELPIGTPIEHTMTVIRDVEARIVEAIDPAELDHVVTTAGPESWWQSKGGNEGEVDVMVVPVAQRDRSIAEIEKSVREAVEGIPGARIRIRQRSSNMLMRFMRGGGEDRVSVEIRGHELDTADALSQRVVDAVQDVPGVTHARADRELGQLERMLTVDRTRASELGLGSADVAAAVEHYVLGRVATRLREHGDEFDVRVVLSPEDRLRLEQLPELPVLTPDGRRVPLSALVDVTERRGPSSIARLDQERIVRVDVGVADRPLDEIAEDIDAAIARIETPEGFTLALGGELTEQEEAFSNLLLGIVLAIFLVFTVMAVQFESLKQPLVVMVSVPFAFIGVVLALVTTGTTFNMNSFLGAIVLVGIVVNNAIVMIDHANGLRREGGMQPGPAIVTAAVRRLRPILMTTATTVLAMLPLALATTEGSEIQAPLARVVVGGLLTSTLVTLVVVPCVYALAEGGRVRVRREAIDGAPAE